MKQPRVSVIMSVYKEPEEWLRIAIQSILDQTFSDFEFIIINDNPNNPANDGILREFAEKDARVVVIANETNIGLTKSLNKGLRIARGYYIARMDADDMSLPRRFEMQVGYLDRHPEILCVGSWTGNIDEKGNRMNSVGRYETDYRWVRAQFIQNSQISHPAAMYHRIVNDKLIQYDETVRYAQDYSLMVSILEYGEIANIPEVLFCYRNSNSQITSSKKAEQQVCAFKAQQRAFSIFGLKASPKFQELFHSLTIKHEMEQPVDMVIEEFRKFFKENKVNKTNSLILELIYSTYLTYLRHHNSQSWRQTLPIAFKRSSSGMRVIGMKLFCHLLLRKVNRRGK